MTHRATSVLSLCFSLLTPLGASAQSSAPVADTPATPSVPADTPASPSAPAAPSETPPQAPAPEQTPTPPSPAETAPASGVQAEDANATAAPVVVAPAPEPLPSITAVEPQPTTSPTATVSANTSLSTAGSDAKKKNDSAASQERCAQLMAQGNSALAQAEGCGGGDTPIFAGSIAQLSESVAPLWRTLPDADNGFAALSVYVAPRLRLTEEWAVIADTSLNYEQTPPDDTADRHEAQWTDPRVTVLGNLGNLKGVTFTGGPRLVAPLARQSRAADAFVGTGVTLNAVKPFDVLGGLALVAGGAYSHTFLGNLTRTSTSDGANEGCNDLAALSVTCPVSGVGLVRDSVRAVGTASLNVNEKWSAQASYLYAWSFVQRLPNPNAAGMIEGVISDDTPVLVNDETGHSTSRVRRLGSFTLTANYQPTDWVIASLAANTSVCYHLADGGQSALGGCAGGYRQSDFWLRNPIVNKFSTVSLSFTIPLDTVYMRVKNRGSEEKKTASKKSRNTL